MDPTPILRGYARYRKFRLDRMDAAQVQKRVLMSLLRRAKSSMFGRDHGFAAIGGVADYQDRVPLRTYEDFQRDYWDETFPHIDGATWCDSIRHFSITAGTSGANNKYIPCPRTIMRSHMRAISDVFCHHLLNRPASRVFAGRNLVLYGSLDLTELAPGIICGDLTGIGGMHVPRWARRWRFVPDDLELIADWEHKIRQLAERALRANIRAIAGYPSWLLFFFARLAEAAGRPGTPLADLLPNLELIIHGGVHLAPYRPLFDELLAGSRAELRETYAASEAFVAAADRGPDQGLRLIIDNGIFFEFVPLEEMAAARPARHWVRDIETNRDYAVVITSCAGLWSYVLGDTVRFVERDPPRLLVTGRLGKSLTAFGEHLLEIELEEAASAAAASIGKAITDFTVFSIFPDRQGEPGRHGYLVEFAPPLEGQDDLARFTERLDRELCHRNDNYRLYRERDIVLASPDVSILPPGTFTAWLKSRGKIGGQNKVPRILLAGDILSDLLNFTRGCAEIGVRHEPR